MPYHCHTVLLDLGSIVISIILSLSVLNVLDGISVLWFYGGPFFLIWEALWYYFIPVRYTFCMIWTECEYLNFYAILFCMIWEALWSYFIPSCPFCKIWKQFQYLNRYAIPFFLISKAIWYYSHWTDLSRFQTKQVSADFFPLWKASSAQFQTSSMTWQYLESI